ncbi:MAG: hypothetical protein JWR38_5917 [Mucilaginibacter sp.]|nr:hypothetical protein [Mucilaginibacter sp.]
MKRVGLVHLWSAKLTALSRDHRQIMGTKGTIRFQEKEGDLPGWQVYTELFEPADVVYLEVEGIQADVTMIGSPWGHAAGTVLLRLPAATARQLGLVPPDWKNDASGSKVDSVN